MRISDWSSNVCSSDVPEKEITGSLQLAAAQRDVERAGGASWVSLHHGGGVGMGYSQHSGIVIVCDGTEAADKRIARVLWNDPGTGVMRHADAGYDTAKQIGRASCRDRVGTYV